VVRGLGWVLIVSGSVVLLYVVYLLWFTGLETAGEQRELSERFETLTTSPALPTSEPGDAEAAPEPVELGDAFAAMWFERDGERVVNDDVLFVVEGISVADLKRGPGHYPGSAEIGAEGNVGIAGHRTTYGEPFGRLDELTDGDTIHVVDRRGTEWVYAYREQRVVTPSDVWVVEEDDPLELGAPTITLTTCHPRFSAAQRLIAWGELVGPADA
jgi:sortase A